MLRGRGEVGKRSSAAGVSTSVRSGQILTKREFSEEIAQASEEGSIFATRVPFFTPIVSLARITLLTWMLVQDGYESFTENRSIGPSSTSLMDWGAFQVESVRSSGQHWRLVSALFISPGIFLLFATLFLELKIGFDVERTWNGWRVMIIYLISGVSGILATSIFLPKTVIASATPGSASLIGASFAELVVNRNVLVQKACSIFSLFVEVIVICILGTMPFHNNFANLAGLLMGFFLGLLVVPCWEDGSFAPCSRTFGACFAVLSLGVLFFFYWFRPNFVCGSFCSSVDFKLA